MEYKIIGGSFPAISCRLQDNESMIAESGAMIWMSPNMEMSTRGGGIGKMFSRAFSGENLFQNVYTAHGQGLITFGSSFPGEILPLDIAPDREVILQKSSFLASEAGVSMSIHFNRKLGAGFFGGEGFIMQRLSGYGKAFAEIAGDLMEYTLDYGRQLVVSTGNLVGFEPSVQMDIRQVPGIKNKLFGGEGFFNTILTGPGKVWVQTTSISGMAASLAPYLPINNDN
ncbi:MAG: TIGR00266 family protein [Clostridia bacterium]|nr:TIGR00266 family protein [Clostridia bacterium]